MFASGFRPPPEGSGVSALMVHRLARDAPQAEAHVSVMGTDGTFKIDGLLDNFRENHRFDENSLILIKFDFASIWRGPRMLHVPATGPGACGREFFEVRNALKTVQHHHKRPKRTKSLLERSRSSKTPC